MSTIFADKFKNTSGGNNVKVNQLSGIDTAGSITVQGEGSATSNLQQGLAKMFISVNQGGSQSINESFNVSSIADGGTGLTEATLTNAHSDANYVPVASMITASNRRVIVGSQSAHTASIVKYDVFQESTYSSLSDASSVVGNTHGDLA